MNFKTFLIEKGVESNAEKITIMKAIELVHEWEKVKQLNLTDVGRTNLTDKHPIEGVNCFMQTEIEDEDDELVCRSCKTGIDEDEGRFGYCWNCYEN